MRLRILQICEATNAGVGKHTVDLCAGLLAADCDVHLLYSPTRIDDAFHESLPRLQAKGLLLQPLAMRRKPHPQDFLAVSAVRKYIKKCGPFDLVHGQSSKGGAIARLACATSGVPIVYTPHCISTMAPSFGKLSRFVYRWAEWLLAFPTAMILCTSQEELDHIHHLGVPQSKLRVVEVGIEPPPDVDRRALRGELGLPADAMVVGFVGRLSDQKNPEMLVRSFAEAATGVPQARLAFVGTGELQQRCESIAHELGISDRVHWLGYRNGYAVMPAFDILAVPSRYETGPYVMLEAIAVGVPLVITEVGRVREVMGRQTNGLIVPIDDRVAFTHALRHLLHERETRARMAEASKAMAVQVGVGAMVAKTLAAYEHCVTSVPGHRTTQRLINQPETP